MRSSTGLLVALLLGGCSAGGGTTPPLPSRSDLALPRGDASAPLDLAVAPGSDLASPPDLAVPAPDLARGCAAPCVDPTPVCDPDSGRCEPCLLGRDACPVGSYCERIMGGYRCAKGCKSDVECKQIDPGAMRPACCDRLCVDLALDRLHCGKCGGACANISCCGGACTDTKGSIDHCGACGRACNGGQAKWQCLAASCAVGGCDIGYEDCNKDPKDGCEIDLRSSGANCGACGKSCTVPNAQSGCTNRVCTLVACDPGFADCDKDPATGCEINLKNSIQSCGQCGKQCNPPPNGAAGCSNGQCDIGACLQGFDDCDMNVANGCETPVGNDIKNCGACGNVCKVAPNGMVMCLNGVCLGACGGAFKDCNNNMADGCEADTDSDANNCKGCGVKCNLPNAVAGCSGGCVVKSCNQGFGNCNNNPADGCEVTLASDKLHCGQCGNACPMGQSCAQGVCKVGGGLDQPAYNATVVFKDVLQGTTMTVTWDGMNYWSSSGGGQGGVRLARYDANGAQLATYSPGIDFRSVMTKGGNGATVHAREYNSMQIRIQNLPGQFGVATTLAAAPLDAQSSVVFDQSGTELVALSNGRIYRWSAANGAALGNFALVNFTLNGENQSPQNRGVAHAGGYYLTYSSGVLSAWDGNGTRVKSTKLNGAGVSFDSYYGFSWANGKVFIVDAAGGSWRGYDVGL